MAGETMRDECPHCRTVAIVSAADVDLIDRALGVLSSDYNDVDHEAIAALRERLATKDPTHAD